MDEATVKASGSNTAIKLHRTKKTLIKEALHHSLDERSK